MSKRNKHLGFTIENDLHYKLHYVASYEGRSGSGQIIYVLNQYIKNFEKQKITLFQNAISVEG